MAVKNELKKLRKEQRLKQSDLTMAVGMCEKSISNIELEKNPTSLETALRLAAYFKVSVEDIFHLEEEAHEVAKNLPYGKQRRLEIARALATEPKLLLLDEPSMGLAPLLVKEIFNIIKEINESGTTVLLVEQNANMALSIADKAYVLETGRITLSGTAKELASSEAVRKAYLGG